MKKAVRDSAGWDNGKGGWLKLDYAGGGMFVRHLEKITEESVMSGIASIREGAKDSFARRESRIEFKAFWPSNSLTPKGISFVIESDVRNTSDIAVNLNTQLMTYKDGEIRLIKHTQQVTSETGEFLGSVQHLPAKAIKEAVETQAMRAAKSVMDKKYFGVLGVDMFVLQNNEIYMTEVNARPNSCTFPTIVADKRSAPEWISVDVSAQKPIRKLADFVAAVGKDLAYGNVRDGLVVPLAIHTYVNSQEGVVIPSPKFKMMAMADSVSKRDEIIDELVRIRGLKRGD